MKLMNAKGINENSITFKRMGLPSSLLKSLKNTDKSIFRFVKPRNKLKHKTTKYGGKGAKGVKTEQECGKKNMTAIVNTAMWHTESCYDGVSSFRSLITYL